MTIYRQLLRRTIASVYACAALAASSTLANDAPPNFVILLADDLGYSDLGCYGSEIETPNLDRLAAEGLRYSQFYNTARCWPTRASIMTGYYAQQNRRDSFPTGPGGKRGPRPTWAPLLPELLRPLGYRSYHAGKWHIDGEPLDNGFDRSYRLNDHNRFFTPQQHTLDDKPLPPVEPGDDYYATTAIADYTIDFLKAHRQDHGDLPFLAFVAFNAPHFPLHAVPEDIAKYEQVYQAGWDKIRERRWQRMQQEQPLVGQLSALEPEIGPPYHFPEALEKLGPGEVNRELPWSALSKEQQRFQADKMAVHAAMVDRIDQEVGRIIDELRAIDALENTVVLFLSDNGASAEIMVRGDGHDPSAAPGSQESYLCLGPGWSSAANTPFRRHKTWVHEGGTATPLIVHWPAGISRAVQGQWRETPGHVIDVVPTVIELAGGELPETHHDAVVPAKPGQSLAGTFSDPPANEPRTLWWLHEGNRAIRVGDWKLVRAKDEAWQLYDLSRDRTESHDLASKYPERVEELAQRWQELADEFRATANGG